MWSWKFSIETKWPTLASLWKACDSLETVRVSKKYAKTQFLCNSPQNIVDIMESGLTEPPDIELIHADEPPPPGSNLEIKMEMLAEDGCRESHIFPYANFWREIEFSMCSVLCEAFAYIFYF